MGEGTFTGLNQTTMKRSFLFGALLFSGFLTAEARSWRINNNAGVNADFTTFNAAVNAAGVQDGDTIYLEPSTFEYATGSISVTKRLTVIAAGYLLDPSNGTYPGNPGLQLHTYDTRLAFFRLASAASGTRGSHRRFAKLELGERVELFATCGDEQGEGDGGAESTCGVLHGVASSSTWAAIQSRISFARQESTVSMSRSAR